MNLIETASGVLYLESSLGGASRAVMSTRQGGASEGPYGTLNLSTSVGDERARVDENRRRLLDAARLAAPARVKQVHGRDVLAAETGGMAGVGDGLVTAAAGLPLACLIADCAPVAVADATTGLVGIAHAGWRGAASGIVSALLAALQARGARIEALHAAVLPSIGPCCFEVGEEVATLFPAEHVARGPRSKPHLDLKSALRAQLAAAGVIEERIEVWDLCTRCRADLFYSYRRDGQASGRMLAAVVREG